MFSSATRKKRLVGLVLFAIILALFFSFNRFPKLDTVRDDLGVVFAPATGAPASRADSESSDDLPDTGSRDGRWLQPGDEALTLTGEVKCWQGFCIEVGQGPAARVSLLTRWVIFSVTYLRLVTVGMVFAFLMAGIAEAFLFASASGRSYQSGSLFKRTIKGLAVGPVMNLCSACIVPVSAAFRGRGGGIAGAISMVQGSATLNIPALAMAFFVFTPLLGFSRLVLALLGGLLIGPIVVLATRRGGDEEAEQPSLPVYPEIDDGSPWGPVLREGFREWAKVSIGYLVRMGPIMVVAGFGSGLVIQWLSVDTVTTYLGNHALGVAIAATFGILINVPLLFEIPLVALLLLLGMGTAPAATLLFTAAAGGPITFWGLAKVMPRRAIATFATATWGIGAFGGLAVLGFGTFVWDGGAGLRVEAAEAVALTEQMTSGPGEGETAVPGMDMESYRAVMSGANQPYGGFQHHLAQMPVDKFRRSIFTDVTAKAGIDFLHVQPRKMSFPFGAGVVVLDFNKDGFEDIYVANSRGPNALYRNEGDGSFIDMAARALIDDPEGMGNGGCAADYDNDGDPDLYATNYGVSRLYQNNGDGTFSDITSTTVDGHDVKYRSTGCAWGDYDRDGFLDLIVVRHIYEDDPVILADGVFFNPLGSVALYHNDGGETFKEVTSSLGDTAMPDPQRAGQALTASRLGNVWGAGFQPGWLDFDNDGDLDLYIVNDIGNTIQRNVLWRNDGPRADGSWNFQDYSQVSGADINMDGMGLAVGDYDLDGHLDMYMSNIGSNVLLRNTGDGLTFVNTTREARVGKGQLVPKGTRVSWGAAFFDFDNDADEDLFVVSGFLDIFQVNNPEEQANLLLQNVGDGTFADASLWSGVDDTGYGRGGVYLDFDHDGCLDLFFVNYQDTARLFQNACESGNSWLTISTVGTVSNRDGVGARVRVEVDGLSQIREVAAGSSSMSQHTMATHFGLGSAEVVDLIEIRWPSGAVQTMTSVPTNQRITATEPGG